ncbi:MAG TPA: hypothetical protein VL989_01935 [Candidatus Sulfotelmatobacter sp.]|nr:hypothetical protein [Candidatus Sulfotelmatobacter sp.]
MLMGRISRGPTFKALTIGVLLSLVYVALIFFLPDHSNSAHLDNLSSSQYKQALFLVSLPAILVWLIAFYAAGRIRIYAHYLERGKTTVFPLVSLLAKGIFLLALSLPIAAILNRFLNFFEGYSTDVYHASIITTNYVNLILPLFGFVLIYYSVRGITSKKKLDLKLTSAKLLVALYLVIGILYSYETLRHFTSNNAGSNVYYLPTAVFILTILLPYLYAWYIGLASAYDMLFYAKKTPGIIFKRSLYVIASGLAVVIISFIAMQYFSTIDPAYGHLEFNSREIMSALIKLISGLGFYLMARGANKLIRIEEV